MTKIVFFGTSEFAVPALQKLAADPNYEIASVVTQPDKPAGRIQELQPTPVKVEAGKLGLKILQPTSLQLSPSPARPAALGEAGGESASLPKTWGGNEGEVDIFIVASYGNIIPKNILDIPKYGALNIHPSLLPKHRGASPIQAAILDGDGETGVTIMKLDEQMDHGPILSQVKFQIPDFIYFKTLHDKLAEIGADLLIKVLPDYLAGKIQSAPQDHDQATYTKIISKDDGRIKWQDSAIEIDRKIRAFSLWPVTWTTLDGKRIRLFSVDVNPTGITGSPGLIVIKKSNVVVCCGHGTVLLRELQIEGGTRMRGVDFLRGYPGLDSKILV